MKESTPRSVRQFCTIQIIANGASIAGLLLALITPKWLILTSLSLIAGLIIQLAYGRRSTKDLLREFVSEGSSDFVGFFKAWYSRDGKHDIYCRDQDWLDRPELEPVVQALLSRGTQVSIFVREEGTQVCQVLRDAGVFIYTVPKPARAEMMMSLKSGVDEKELIVKRLRSGTQMIRFIQTQDKYILGLAEDLFALYRIDRN